MYLSRTGKKWISFDARRWSILPKMVTIVVYNVKSKVNALLEYINLIVIFLTNILPLCLMLTATYTVNGKS